MLTGKKAVIFDMDGSLVDSMWIWPRDHPDTERCGIRRTDRTIYPHIRKIRSYKID